MPSLVGPWALGHLIQRLGFEKVRERKRKIIQAHSLRHFLLISQKYSVSMPCTFRAMVKNGPCCKNSEILTTKPCRMDIFDTDGDRLFFPTLYIWISTRRTWYRIDYDPGKSQECLIGYATSGFFLWSVQWLRRFRSSPWIGHFGAFFAKEKGSQLPLDMVAIATIKTRFLAVENSNSKEWWRFTLLKQFEGILITRGRPLSLELSHSL